MTTKKVLFATDFSPASKIALHNLSAIKNDHKLDLYLIHVTPSFWKNWFRSGAYEREAQRRLVSWQEELLHVQEPDKLKIEVGHPAESILAYSQQIKPDIILVGSKNPEVRGRYKTGAVAENVVRNAKVPVLVCKHPNFAKILCAIDGSKYSAKTLEKAIEFAKIANSKLTVISVAPMVTSDQIGMPEIELKNESDKVAKQHAKKIDNYLKDFNFSGIDVSFVHHSGIPAHVILDMAEDFDFNLIVVGAKGQSLLKRVLLGSTAERILRYSPCSLLVVR